MDEKEITSKEKVLAVYPRAYAVHARVGCYISRSPNKSYISSWSLSTYAYGDSEFESENERLAWDDAAAKLPAVEDRSGQEPQLVPLADMAVVWSADRQLPEAVRLLMLAEDYIKMPLAAEVRQFLDYVAPPADRDALATDQASSLIRAPLPAIERCPKCLHLWNCHKPEGCVAKVLYESDNYVSCGCIQPHPATEEELQEAEDLFQDDLRISKLARLLHERNTALNQLTELRAEHERLRHKLAEALFSGVARSNITGGTR